MRIGEISELTGLSCSTLRYYEKIELIKNIKLNDSGQREYTEEDLQWIKFVVSMKSACLPIEDIKKFGMLYYSNNEDFNERLSVALECREKLIVEKKKIDAGIDFLNKKVNLYKSKLKDKTE
ncbi:MAG: MerR family transcriptional regulator [Clostridiales bacterium]|nr:MerR family transcriptional regulator [Clostridiales bacterium]